MTPKEKLLVLAATFGIITEGLTTNAQLQEAVEANTGYQEYQKAVTAAAEANTAKAAAEQKEAAAVTELNTVKAEKAQLETIAFQAAAVNEKLQSDLDAANAKLEVFAQVEAQADADKIYYTSEAGGRYEVTQSQFRFQGQQYKTADAVAEHSDVFETLIAAKSFILKKV